MKNDLTCGVVRDLLPSYVEGLTCADTNEALRRHLAACPNCAARRAAMLSPENTDAQQEREMDYLKTLRRKSARRAAAAGLCTLAAVLLLIAAKLFIIGTPLQPQGLSWSIRTETAGEMELRAYSNWSGTAYHGWEVEQEDGGVVRITCRQVLPSPLWHTAEYRTVLSTADIHEVWLGDQLVWQNGAVISRRALELYEEKTAYAGDASAFGSLAASLYIGDTCGAYTLRLQTAQEPYGWTLDFSGDFTAAQALQVDAVMERQISPILLALVENLGEVSWTYSVEGQAVSRSVSLAQADAALPQGVKSYAATAADFQQLYTLVTQ